jgi:hypothetical protein
MKRQLLSKLLHTHLQTHTHTRTHTYIYMSKMLSETDISFQEKCSLSLLSKKSRSLRCNFLVSTLRKAKTERRNGKSGVLAFLFGCKVHPLIQNKTTLLHGINLFRSYVGPRPTLWFSYYRRFSWSLTLSNPIFLPPAYSPALIYFGRERGWWITCNYSTVLKEQNRNRKTTTCAICWLKSILHE